MLRYSLEKLTYKNVLTFGLIDVNIKKYRAEIEVKNKVEKNFKKNFEKFLKKC